VANGGPDAADGVVLTATLPATLTFLSVVATQGSCTGTTVVSCSLGTLASGLSIAVTLTVSPASAGTFSAEIAVTSAVADPNTANNHSTVLVTVAAQSAGDGGSTGGKFDAGVGGPGVGVNGAGAGGGCATTEGSSAGTLLALVGSLLFTAATRRRSWRYRETELGN